MKSKAVACILLMSVFLSACGPGQLLVPTLTPAPSMVLPTLIPTAILPSPTPMPSNPPSLLPAEFVWMSAGDPNPFLAPVGVTLDLQGNIYVFDLGNARVQKFDSSGKFLLMWGSPGSGDGQFKNIDKDSGGLALDSLGNVYVLDDGNNRVQKFDSNGNYLTQWGMAGSGDGQFTVPTGIAIDKNDNIYVDDWKNNNVQKFDENGKFLLRWGKAGLGDGEFQLLTAMAIDPQGNLLVAEDGRIQRFSNTGQFLSRISPDPLDGHTIEFWGVSVDSRGNIYVADHNSQRIVKLDSTGQVLATWNGKIAGAQEFKDLEYITVDGLGNVYVTDRITNLLQVFRQPGFLP